MRLCERNCRELHYALYQGQEELVDEWGNYTGETKPLYGDPVSIRANISPAKGSASIEMFGTDLNYSKTIVTTDMSCPIDENSILWVDESDTEKPHDYIVVSVAKSLTNIAYAVKKVDVDAV